MKITIVSASDAKFFQMLKGLVLSIHDHRPNSEIDISIFDLGLTTDQLSELNSLGVKILPAPDCLFESPAALPYGEWFKTMMARPRFPQFLPNHDLIIWIDADAWIQDWRAIELFVWCAQDGHIAIVPEMDRCYSESFRYGLIGNPMVRQRYIESFGEKLGLELSQRPVINSGIFALRSDSPVWKIWGEWLERAMSATPHQFSEQYALNAAIYSGGVRMSPLPARCNWICGQALPYYAPKTGLFTEGMPPYDPLWIIHATGKKFRDPEEAGELLTYDIVTFPRGDKMKLPLDYLRLRQIHNTST